MPIELTGQERALYETLLERDSGLAAIYLGALHVLKDEVNSDGLALAAHGIREMMNKIPKVLDVPAEVAEVLRERMNDKARAVEDLWDEATKNSTCRKKNGWGGTIDSPLRRLLASLDDFIGWLKENRPRRKAAMGATLRRMDPSGRDLPPHLVNLNVDRWVELLDFFVNVAHHRQTESRKVFQERLDALQAFLLDRLSPRTFQDTEVIDSILEQARRDD